MSVEVIFRGVCLFREEDRRPAKTVRRRLRDILIPETNAELAKEWDLPQHFARLVVLDVNGNVVSRHKLDGTRVEIADLLGGPCVLQPSFDGIQDLAEAAKATVTRLSDPAGSKDESEKKKKQQASKGLDELDVTSPTARSEQEKNATSRIACVGGAMSANEASDAWRSADGKTAPAALVTWRSLSGAAVIRLSPKDPKGTDAGENVTTSLVLDANHPRAYVYHYDEEWPTVSQLSGIDEGKPTFKDQKSKDEDFAWLYRVLHPKLSPYKDDLAVPVLDEAGYNKGGARNPGSSAGCFPGRL